HHSHPVVISFFLSMPPPPPSSTLFPYTTLFRSHALVVANMILGGQFVSRINLNLREDKGFTYGARTAFEFRRLPSPFVLQEFERDRKSTRLNSSHRTISYAVFCLKKKNTYQQYE